MIKCAVCNKKMKWITHTHLKLHNLTTKEYKNKFPNSNMISKETSKKISNAGLGNVPWNKGETGCSCGPKKGHIPWNKGMKNCYTPEQIKRIKEGRKGMKLSESHKKAIGEGNKLAYAEGRKTVLRGANAPNWRGGISKTPYSSNWKSIAKTIRKRDSYRCQHCGITQTELLSNNKYRLNVHHIDYDKTNNDYYNLISLCGNCHEQTNFNRNYWKDLYFKLMNYREDI